MVSTLLTERFIDVVISEFDYQIHLSRVIDVVKAFDLFTNDYLYITNIVHRIKDRNVQIKIVNK